LDPDAYQESERALRVLLKKKPPPKVPEKKFNIHRGKVE